MIRKEEFLSKVEELKKIDLEESNVELVENSLEETQSFIPIYAKKLLDDKGIILGWGVQEFRDRSGSINDVPFSIFNRPSHMDGAVLTMPNKIAKYDLCDLEQPGSHTYEEYNYDGEYRYGIIGQFGLETKKFYVDYDSKKFEGNYLEGEGSGYKYYEEVKKELSLPNQISDEKVNSILGKLMQSNIAATLPEKNDNTSCYKSFLVHSLISEHYGADVLNGIKTVDDVIKANVHCYASYLNEEQYLEGGLPYYIHFISYCNKAKKNIDKYFVLLKDGRYVDTELCYEKGINESVVTIDEIKQFLKRYNLSLDLSERLRNYIINEEIPTLDVRTILSKARNR